MMRHELILQLPDEVYQPLIKTASQSGYTPEQLAIHWLIARVRQTHQDPLEEFIGSISSKTTDWVDQHDAYLGQEILKQIAPHTT
ncbi:MAG: hypothetical protein WCL57_15995 [Chloroflexota bacterium]